MREKIFIYLAEVHLKEESDKERYSAVELHIPPERIMYDGEK